MDLLPVWHEVERQIELNFLLWVTPFNKVPLELNGWFWLLGSFANNHGANPSIQSFVLCYIPHMLFQFSEYSDIFRIFYPQKL